MCGICGFFGDGGREDLKNMADTIFHRGPDDEGLWFDENKRVYLGFRRLAIIDISGGKQPMWTQDGKYGIVFNGEIYNHLELREELQKSGYKFVSDHSDTEVLLMGYQQWGNALPEKLNGMWSFVIYDVEKQTLFGSRDRFGKKPFFYTLQNGTFGFASELNCLIKHKSIQANISKRSLKKFFGYGYIPAPNSLYENIFKLPGGYNITVNLKQLSYKIEKYWDFVLEPFDSIPKNPEEKWGEEIRYLLEKSVQRRLMSDVPLGIFLSGGIDSSAITCFARKVLGENELMTFSIGFEEESFDESAWAEKVAKMFQTSHYHETLSINEAHKYLPKILSMLDEPMGDSSLLPTYMLSMITRKNVTVALGGDAGDELFAGYDPFKALKMAEIYSTLIPKPIHQGIKNLIYMLSTSHRNMSLDFKLKRTIRGLSYPKQLWNPVWLGPLEPKEIEELFSEPVDIEDLYSETIEYWDNCKQDNIVDKTLQLYTKLYLQDDILVKVDRASMMNSLEVRAPFLDIELVNLVRKIPNNYKLRNGERKYILKKALKPVLPDEILYRKKKGFGIPIGMWFKDKSIKIDTEKKPKLLNNDFLMKYYDQHLKNKQDNRAFLWNYMILDKFIF